MLQKLTTFSLRTLAFIPAAALAATLLLPPSAARADVRYVSQMSFGDGTAKPADGGDAGGPPTGMGMPLMRTTTSVKDMNERVETEMNMGPMHSDTVTLTLCAKHQTIKMDPALKIYTVEPIGVAQFSPPSTSRRRGMGTGDAMPEGGAPGVGHVTMTFTVQDLGPDKVADIDAHHYKISIRNQTSGCLGDHDTTFLMEEWIAPIKAGLNCPERFAPTRTVPNENGCQITYDMKGDFAQMRDLSGGMPVRTRFYEGDKAIMTSELRDYSTAALDDSLFAPPADFKEVSEADFNQEQSDAMRKGMMDRMGATPSNPPADGSAQNGDNPQNGNGDTNGQTQQPSQDDQPKKKRGGFHLPSGLPF